MQSPSSKFFLFKQLDRRALLLEADHEGRDLRNSSVYSALRSSCGLAMAWKLNLHAVRIAAPDLASILSELCLSQTHSNG